MLWPIRYTPSSPSVNRMRFRRSETAKMFFRLSITLIPASRELQLPDYFRAAAGRGDLLRGCATELVRAHRQRLVHPSAAEHLHRRVAARDQSMVAQKVGSHNRAGVEFGRQRVEVHHRVL